MKQSIDKLAPLIGNTPLIEILYRLNGAVRSLFVKLEQYNLTGSIKDRMAYHVLQCAVARGDLQPGAPIVEATSGNTGISLAALGALLGHPVVIFMPEWMSDERKKLIRSYGAEVHFITAEEGGFSGSVERTRSYKVDCPEAFLPNQFCSKANSEAHARTTGPEILKQLDARGLKPDHFIAGVGTGGTIMGVGQALRQTNPKVKLHPVEPAEAPIMTKGLPGGQHRIEGIGDGFIPGLVNMSFLNQPLAVRDSDAILMAQKLAAFGLAVGISSGANFLAAALVQEEHPEETVTTVFSDDNKKYLSTDLMQTILPEDDSIVPQIELLSIH